MKKLLVSAMAGVIAFGSVNALAASKLIEFVGVEVPVESAMTRDEMLTVLNDVQKEELKRKKAEEEAAKKLAQLQAAGLAEEQLEMVEEEPPVEVVEEEPVVEEFKVNMSKSKGASITKKYGTTSFKAILEAVK